MPPLRLTDGMSCLEIDLADWDGDAYVTVAIESSGYAGRNDLHVVSEDFTEFCSSLIELQRTLKGRARLTGVMPEELDIVFTPAGSLGHIAVTGHTGYHVQMAHTTYWHAVHFGFQIEPTELDAAAAVPWVAEHAVKRVG